MSESKSEDVMKALECHSLAGISSCNDCPYCDISEQGDCGCDMARDALALLREKDARLEHLEEAMRESISWHTELLENLNKLVEQKDAELERKRERIVDLKCEIERLTKQKSISEEA